MAVWYIVPRRFLSTGIQAVEVIRETEKYVYVRTQDGICYRTGERRESKRSEYEECFPTWEEARAAYIARAEQLYQQAINELGRSKDMLDKARGHLKPELPLPKEGGSR